MQVKDRGVDAASDSAGPLLLTEESAARALSERRMLAAWWRLRADDVRTTARLRRRMRRAIERDEAERRRWARELHDDALQSLAAMRVILTSAMRSRDEATITRAAHDVADLLSEQIEGLRRMVDDLRPIILDELGLVSAVSALVERTNLGPSVAVLDTFGDLQPDGPRLPRRLELTAYRVVQEAVTNAVRHADASRIVVSLDAPGGASLEGSVCDDGIGFDLGDPNFRHGLTSMRERCILVGGTFDVNSQPAGGTQVRFRLPICHG